jgi:hypothetical protein
VRKHWTAGRIDGLSQGEGLASVLIVVREQAVYRRILHTTHGCTPGRGCKADYHSSLHVLEESGILNASQTQMMCLINDQNVNGGGTEARGRLASFHAERVGGGRCPTTVPMLTVGIASPFRRSAQQRGEMATRLFN